MNQLHLKAQILLNALRSFQYEAVGNNGMSGKDKVLLDSCTLSDSLMDFINSLKKEECENLSFNECVHYFSLEETIAQETDIIIDKIQKNKFDDSISLTTRVALKAWSEEYSGSKHSCIYLKIIKLELGMKG